LALEIAKDGQPILVNYFRRLDGSAHETVEEIKTAGGDAIAIAADCTKPEQNKEMFNTLKHYDRVDVLINYAGEF